MENGYGYNGFGLYRQGSGVWRSLRDGDFEEEDVWAVIKERKDSNSKVGGLVHEHGQSIFEPQNSVKRSLPSASRMIPRASIGTTSSSSSSGSSSSTKNEGRGVKQQSAPVTIPDWSKVHGKKANKGFKHHDYEEEEDDDDDIDGHDYNGDTRDSDDEEEEEEEQEDEYNYMIPPHEIVARRQARSQISSFSVFEGVGRKLKGRDLSKVRNAVLTKTGFLE